ncbi:class I SAM-dependent methyltransferase [Candidatus Woesearchaeota archaeon]|nr:class I SAM-dependent methyltransferase [Candidatus Woesearchaeota archaeon]
MSRSDLYAKKVHFGLPEQGELDQIRRVLERNVKKGDHVLVLGATAELRSIALELGCNVVSVDISLDMIQKREGNVTVKDHTKDVVARGNWLDMWFLGKHQFSAVLADASFNNVSFDHMILLMKKLPQLLRPEGIILFRHLNLHNSISINELVELYQKKNITAKELVISLHLHKGLPRQYSNKRVHMIESFDAIISVLKKHHITGWLPKLLEAHKWDGYHMMVEEKEFHDVLNSLFGTFQKLVCKSVYYSSFNPLYLVIVR